MVAPARDLGLLASYPSHIIAAHVPRDRDHVVTPSPRDVVARWPRLPGWCAKTASQGPYLFSLETRRYATSSLSSSSRLRHQRSAGHGPNADRHRLGGRLLE